MEDNLLRALQQRRSSRHDTVEDLWLGGGCFWEVSTMEWHTAEVSELLFYDVPSAAKTQSCLFAAGRPILPSHEDPIRYQAIALIGI